jgi:hypothetical protein
MGPNPPPENSFAAAGKLRVTLGHHLQLSGAFSFFIDENRKAWQHAQQLRGGALWRVAASDVCRLESPPAAGLV